MFESVSGAGACKAIVESLGHHLGQGRSTLESVDAATTDCHSIVHVRLVKYCKGACAHTHVHQARRRQKPLDVERRWRHLDQRRQLKVVTFIDHVATPRIDCITARQTHRSTQATQSIAPDLHVLSPLEVCINSSTLTCTLHSSRARRLGNHRLSLSSPRMTLLLLPDVAERSITTTIQIEFI